jgi:ABC-type transport system involved in multi-copper enzyme maturation permease subunit
MLGCIFDREAETIPRREKHYASRAMAAVSALLILITGWLMLNGLQSIEDVGDLAAFGSLVFQILVPVFLFVLLFMATTSSVLAVSQEKDRKTLDLLLLSSMTSWEIVIGKFSVGFLNGVNLLLPASVVWFCVTLFGGVSNSQIFEAVCLGFGAINLGSSLGSMVAFWRDKTFQSLAICFLGLLFLFGGLHWLSQTSFAIVSGFESMSPIDAVAVCVQPIRTTEFKTFGLSSPMAAALSMIGFSVVFNLLAIVWLRHWNPSRSKRIRVSNEESFYAEERSSAGPVNLGTWKGRNSKHVWKNPVLWREMCTWAYGRKVLAVRFAYVAMAAIVFYVIQSLINSGVVLHRSDLENELVPLLSLWSGAFFILSLVIVNALAVNSVANERDANALELLLASEITPTAFLVGKIVGVLYVAKEMVCLPMILPIVIWTQGGLSSENLVFVELSLIALNLFVVMLGIHCAMIYEQSRVAIGTSLGTVFFLFVGVIVCMLMMIGFRGSFERQLAPFLGIILGGGAALYMGIVSRRPSAALTLSAFGLPFLTFFAITSFLLRDQELTVFSVLTFAYGFTTIAMFIPAWSDFEFSFGHDRLASEKN